MAERPRHPTLKGSYILWGVLDVTFVRPQQGRMDRVSVYRGRRPPTVGLAHGYYLSAFQAASDDVTEDAHTIYDSLERSRRSAFKATSTVLPSCPMTASGRGIPPRTANTLRMEITAIARVRF